MLYTDVAHTISWITHHCWLCHLRDLLLNGVSVASPVLFHVPILDAVPVDYGLRRLYSLRGANLRLPLGW